MIVLQPSVKLPCDRNVERRMDRGKEGEEEYGGEMRVERTVE